MGIVRMKHPDVPPGVSRGSGGAHPKSPVTWAALRGAFE